MAKKAIRTSAKRAAAMLRDLSATLRREVYAQAREDLTRTMFLPPPNNRDFDRDEVWLTPMPEQPIFAIHLMPERDWMHHSPAELERARFMVVRFEAVVHSEAIQFADAYAPDGSGRRTMVARWVEWKRVA